MDALTLFVSVAHLKVRLDLLQILIRKNPNRLGEYMAMDIKRPIELAGMKARLARAKAAEDKLSGVGKRYDTVLDKIDEATGVIEGHAGQLEQYEGDLRKTIEGMVAGSNGAPTDGVVAGPGSTAPTADSVAEPAASWVGK